MPQEDYVLKEIERLAHFLSQLMVKISRASNQGPESAEFQSAMQALREEERLNEFMNESATDDDLEAIISGTAFTNENRLHLAELLITLAEQHPERSGFYYQRARFLLDQPSETISLRQLELMNKIPG